MEWRGGARRDAETMMVGVQKETKAAAAELVQVASSLNHTLVEPQIPNTILVARQSAKPLAQTKGHTNHET